MSVKIARYGASESNFTKTGRVRTEIPVPASVGFTDLTASRVVLDCQMTVQQGPGPVYTDVILPVTFGNQQMVGAQSLIRNAAVISQQAGVLNERRNQNVLSANLDWYTNSRAKEDELSLTGHSTTASYGIDRISLLPDCPFIQYKRPTALTGTDATVTQASYSRRAEVLVPWRHIDNFAGQPQFANALIGDLTYRLELENVLDVVAPAKMPFCAAEAANNTAAVANRLKTFTLSKAVSQFWRPPKQGDIATAYFKQATTNNFAGPWDVTVGGVALKIGEDEVESVVETAGFYVVTLKVGWTTTGATEACEQIKVFYWGANEQFTVTLGPLPQLNTCNKDASNFIGSALSPLVIAKNVCGGLQSTKFDQALTVDSLNSISWYVGAPVQLVGLMGTTLQVVVHESEISSVKVNGDNLEIILVTPFNAGTIGGASMFNPTLNYRDSYQSVKFTCSWTIDEIYAELFKLQLTPQQLQKAKATMMDAEIPFMDQMLVQRAQPTGTAHTDIVQCPANTCGLAVMTPQNLQLISGFDNATGYRFAINGKETTNQIINVGAASSRGRAIHNVMLKSFFGNLNMNLKKYDAPRFNYVDTADQQNHAIYPLIVPVLPAESTVQIQLFSDVAMAAKNIYYVFFRQRLLKVSNGRIQVSA